MARKTATCEAPTVVTAYKGFDRNWQCRGFQFEIGQVYEHDGPVSLCNSGFHACLAPLDAFGYYALVDGAHYAEVVLEGVSAERLDDTKVVAQKLTVVRELTVDEIVQAQLAWTQAQKGGQASSGNYSKAASSGNYSKAASSGNSSTAASSGDYSKAASSGDSSKAASSGNSSTAASSGDYSTAASSGYSSTAASSGNSSTAASSGNYSKAECDTSGFACVAGVGGRVRGNAGSALSLGYLDAQGRIRIAVAYVGEDGIEPGVWYRATDTGTVVPA